MNYIINQLIDDILAISTSVYILSENNALSIFCKHPLPQSGFLSKNFK